MQTAHSTMTLGELGNRYETKGGTNAKCTARTHGPRCAGMTLGVAFKVDGRWACAQCARSHAIWADYNATH